MNCANHSELPVSAYCQNCGKPLCTQCVRSVAGVVYCEPCLAARLHPASAGASSAGTAGTSSAGTGPGAAAWTRVPAAAQYQAARSNGGASPVLAGFLGLIPGVGAMYNGQFVKAFAHVLVFVILVGVTDHFDPAGMLVAAWVIYQIFDAVHTAIARREGRPLPDPFGLNDLGQRLGVPAASTYGVPPSGVVPPAGQPGWAGAIPGDPAVQAFVSETPASPPPGATPAPGSPEWEAWAQHTAAEKGTHDAGYAGMGGTFQPVAPLPVVTYAGRPEPIGAIVLIAVGMLFLLSTLGVFRFDWIGRGWPVIIIVIGAWLLIRRVRTTPRVGGGL